MKTAADFLDEEFVTIAPDEDKTPVYAPDCYQLAVHADRIKKVMQAYAHEAIAEHLERAAKEARIKTIPHYGDVYREVDGDSVRNIEIILK
jgi:hypothetical protein